MLEKQFLSSLESLFMHFTPYGEGEEEVTSPTVERCFEAAVFGGQTLWRLRG
jgi:hypothetical protein